MITSAEKAPLARHLRMVAINWSVMNMLMATGPRVRIIPDVIIECPAPM